MIAAVTGELREVGEDRVWVAVGPMVLEVLVPASELPALSAVVGGEVKFHTLMYLEGESGGGNSEPRLLGFRSLSDKRFFEKFITVKGIGPRKALRALEVDIADVAAAIEGKDPKKLSTLPGIGKRLAEQIIAELAGKVEEFAVGAGKGGAFQAAKGVPPGVARSPAEEDAILTLMTLGERRGDAETLLERARNELGSAAMSGTDTLVRTMLRLRSGG